MVPGYHLMSSTYYLNFGETHLIELILGSNQLWVVHYYKFYKSPGYQVCKQFVDTGIDYLDYLIRPHHRVLTRDD